MQEKAIDAYLCECWNGSNLIQKIEEENLWEFCRILENSGFLESNPCAITTLSIGPFKVASKIDIGKKELLLYFIEVILPGILSKTYLMPFEQFYSLYLLPIGQLLIKLAANNVLIKDLLQWEILLFIKQHNKVLLFPTRTDIKKDDWFSKFEEQQIDRAIDKLKKINNLLGDPCLIVKEHHDGRFESLV